VTPSDRKAIWSLIFVLQGVYVLLLPAPFLFIPAAITIYALPKMFN